MVLLISVGPVVGHLSLHRVPSSLAASLRRQLAGFTLPCSPRVRRSFSLELTFSDERDADGEPTPMVRTSDDEIDVCGPEFSAALACEGRAKAEPWTGVGHCHASLPAVRSLLRMLWSVFLVREGGGLFRGCGVQHAGLGAAAIAAGGGVVEGLAKAVQDPDDLLSEDVLAIFPGPSGTWRVSGTPFGDSRPGPAVSLESFPLAALGVVTAARSSPGGRAPSGSESGPLSREEAALHLLASLVWQGEEVAGAQESLRLARAICGKTPARLLAGRPQSVLSSLLDGLGGKEAGSRARRGPQSPRELIASLRAKLARHGRYAFRPRGGSMRPFVRSGDSVFIQSAREDELRAGNVILYWRAGARPQDDSLICHRLVGRRPGRAGGARIYAKGDSLVQIESFDSGRQAEVLGRVEALCRDGRTLDPPSRLGGLALLGASLLIAPLMKLRLWL